MNRPILGPMKRTLALLLLAGCASSPSSRPDESGTAMDRVKLNNRDYEIDYTRETEIKTVALPASRVAIWNALSETHRTLGLKRLTADSAQGTVAYEASSVRTILGKRVSSYFDCGLGAGNVPRADSYSVTVHVDHKITAVSDRQSQLLIRVTATARNRGLNSDVVQCSSFGTLESRISELVAARL